MGLSRTIEKFLNWIFADVTVSSLRLEDGVHIGENSVVVSGSNIIYDESSGVVASATEGILWVEDASPAAPAFSDDSDVDIELDGVLWNSSTDVLSDGADIDVGVPLSGAGAARHLLVITRAWDDRDFSNTSIVYGRLNLDTGNNYDTHAEHVTIANSFGGTGGDGFAKNYITLMRSPDQTPPIGAGLVPGIGFSLIPSYKSDRTKPWLNMGTWAYTNDGGNAQPIMAWGGGRWRTTDAITTISLDGPVSGLNSGSNVVVIGLK